LYPDFICIGAPKAGTTWLFDNLKQHPKIWVPPVKGVQYFSGRANIKRFKKLRREYPKVLRPKSWQEFLWYCRYFLWPIVNEKWYGSLFPSSLGITTGEFAPAYTACDQKTVERIKQLMPQVKIIFFMRNPIERAWSHAVLGLAKNRHRSIEEVPENEIYRSLSGELSTLKSSYLRTLKIWQKVFPENQLFIRFFEEISEHPYDLLRDICVFLGLEFNKNWFKESAERNIFKGNYTRIPDNIYSFLCQKYFSDIKALNNEFGSYTNRWLSEVQHCLDKSKSGLTANDL
jgi:hypothetical protein